MKNNDFLIMTTNNKNASNALLQDSNSLKYDPDFSSRSIAEEIKKAADKLKTIVNSTPLHIHEGLSKKYNCEVYLKREDLQKVRSYKLRGAYNMMSSLAKDQLSKGVVCASAGNHAQGFAYSCRELKVNGVIFMPTTTPRQKIAQTRHFGQEWIDIILEGDTFDDCADASLDYTAKNGLTFIPPFNDPRIIAGQGTIALECLDELDTIDYIIAPVGGGGLVAGICAYCETFSPHTTIIGAEPAGAPSMLRALKAGQPVYLDDIDRFVDGAAVKQVGDVTFAICKNILKTVSLIPEGKVCSLILKLYNEDAIVVEPAGALAIAALDDYQEQIRNKRVVCIVSGGNNDINRMPEIKERSLQFEGVKHYFLVSFSQRPGALKSFVNDILSNTDDITRFEYLQRTNKETGPALVGIELANPADYEPLIERMQAARLSYTEINKNDSLFGYLV